jgi:hypothetical protein
MTLREMWIAVRAWRETPEGRRFLKRWRRSPEELRDGLGDILLDMMEAK